MKVKNKEEHAMWNSFKRKDEHDKGGEQGASWPRYQKPKNINNLRKI